MLLSLLKVKKYYKIKIQKSERWPDKDTPVRKTTIWEWRVPSFTEFKLGSCPFDPSSK